MDFFALQIHANLSHVIVIIINIELSTFWLSLLEELEDEKKKTM